MLRIVLPGVISAPIGNIGVAIDIRITVGVVYEIIVVIDVHIIISTAPAAVIPAPATTPCRSHHHADAEGDCHASRIVTGWRISDRGIGIYRRRAVYDCRIVAGDVDDFRTRRLHYDHLLALDNLGFNFLLLRGFQVSAIFGFLAHTLHRIHDIALLCKKRVSQIGGPLDVVGKILCDIGKRCQRLNTWIPILFFDRISQRFVFQVLVLLEPLLQLDNFERVSGSYQHLAKEGIWIKSDGGDQ